MSLKLKITSYSAGMDITVLHLISSCKDFDDFTIRELTEEYF